MSFVRRKKVNGRYYRYEVESLRQPDGSVTQRVIRYLGPEAPIYGTQNRRRSPVRPKAE